MSRATIRRALVLLVTAACVAPGPARAERTVRGTIRVATGTPVSDGQARPQRCLHALDDGFQGTFGWVLDVTGGATFALDGTSPLTDVDIDFFRTLTPCQSDPDVATYPDDETYDNQTGDESGAVPPFATAAIVTMRNGPPDATFVYSEA